MPVTIDKILAKPLLHSHKDSDISDWTNANNKFVNVTGDTMTGTLQINVPTATSEALILKTTDDNTTKNLLELQKSDGTVLTSISPTGKALFQNSVDSTTGFQIFDADGGTPIFNVNTTHERVGIGTDAPKTKLHIIGGLNRTDNTGIGATVIANRTDGKTVAIQAGYNNSSFMFDEAGGFQIQARTKVQILAGVASASDAKLTVLANGNVGIGTTNPGAQLHIQTSGTAVIGQIIKATASQTANLQEWQTSDGAIRRAFNANGIDIVMADQTTDVAPNDDTTLKKISLQKLASAPTNAAYIAFANNPGSDVFYLVLEEG